MNLRFLFSLQRKARQKKLRAGKDIVTSRLKWLNLFLDGVHVLDECLTGNKANLPMRFSTNMNALCGQNIFSYQ
jgi:hypothetical protein